jgi:predicted secreted hydrolase
MRAPRSSVWIAALALAAVALSVVTFLPRSAAQPREIRTELSLADALGTGDTAGYSRAIEPRPFIFPDDHGDHPDFATEWWYLTGNLDASDGRRFGYQLTFFRSALASESADRRSAWATRQAWMAHFAVTDVRANRFHGAERFAREAQQLAGAASSPFRVWLEDWSIEGNAGDGFSVRARASTDSIAIDLAIEQGKPIVLQGDRGLSLKGPEPGNASY